MQSIFHIRKIFHNLIISLMPTGINFIEKGKFQNRNLPFSGGAKGSRTPDLLNAIQTRYQLRYNPKN